MDETVIARLTTVLALAAVMMQGAVAQGIPDPTRPPPNLMDRVAADAAPAQPSGPQLQSILIARHPGGRHVAVIDGQTVRLGDSYKGARVDSMNETQVILVRGKHMQILKLFPVAPTRAASLQR
jgi:MSHA biogenesis protein MshK